MSDKPIPGTVGASILTHGEAHKESDSTVAIAYVHPNQGVVAEKFAWSLATNSANMGTRILAVLSTTSPDQVLSRNEAIAIIRGMDPQPDWMLWWDTDMALPARAIRGLVDSAELYGAKIATCFGAMQRWGHRESQPWTPIANAFFLEASDNLVLLDCLPSHDTPFWCDATGLGFTLVHMSVYDDFPEDRLPFHDMGKEGEPGHDVRFCLVSGEKVLYCPQIRSEHMKLLPVEFSMYLRANGIVTDEDEELLVTMSEEWVANHQGIVWDGSSATDGNYPTHNI